MNFLAHLYLSGRNELLMTGNFMGDGVKGRYFDHYPTEVQKGIRLHRFIDSYTDSHPVTAQTRKILQPHFRKYAGVVSDVFYDHFLAANWSDYHDQKLSNYVADVYGILKENIDLMPERPQHMLPYMIKYDWLSSYAETEGVAEALKGMSRRTPYPSNMENAEVVLKEHYDELKSHFQTFFPDLADASATHLQTL